MYRSDDVPQDRASRDDTGVVRDQARHDLCRNTRGRQASSNVFAIPRESRSLRVPTAAKSLEQ